MRADVLSHISRADSLQKLMSEKIGESDTRIQGVFSNHVVLLASGLIELSCEAALSEYARVRGDVPLSRFVSHSVSRQNSLIIEKIRLLLDKFDRNFYPKIESKTSNADRDAVDSLKAIRDKIAHGKSDGTGFSTTSQYYASAKRFSVVLIDVVLK